MRTLSIKALIVVAFGVIFTVIIGTSTIVWLGQQRAQVALQQHQQALRQAAARSGADLSALQASARALDQNLEQSTWVMVGARVFSLTMAVWLALAIYRRVAQLVRTTEDYAQRIGSGELGARFEADAGGETAALAQALNAMVQRLHEALQREAAAGARLTALLQTAPISIYAARTHGDHGATYISSSVRRQLGYAPEDFIADPGFWLSHVHPEDQARVLAQQGKILHGEPSAPLEYRFLHQDGSWRWMHDELALARDAAGQPLELVGSWVDISARKALEQSLRRRDAILAAVAYGSTRFMSAGNDSSAAQWALAVEAVLTRLGEATGVQRVWLAQLVQTDDARAVLQPVQCWSAPAFTLPEADSGWLRRGTNFEREGLAVEGLRLRRGETVHLRVNELPALARQRFGRLNIAAELLVPIQLEDQWWGVLAFDDGGTMPPWQDIEMEAMRTAANLFGAAYLARSDRQALRQSLETLGSVLEKLKRQSAAIERQNQELTQLARMKSEFLSTITHELRTPLNGILGFAELLESGVGGSLTPAQQGHASEIVGAGRDMLALVNRLLELAQIDAGERALLAQHCDLAALLRDTAQAHELAARAHGIALRLELPAQPLQAWLDPQLMRRLLGVLLDNAIKFSQDGGEVTLRAAQTGAGLGVGEGAGAAAGLRIDVSDHGIGISEQDQQRLFTPFVQLDAKLARQYGGAGLGLALARRIARLHGGDITVQSQPGVGSCFTVSLPLKAAEGLDARDAANG